MKRTGPGRKTNVRNRMPLTLLRPCCFQGRQSRHHSAPSTPGRMRSWSPSVDKDQAEDPEHKQQLLKLSFAQDVKNQLVYLDEAVEGDSGRFKKTQKHHTLDAICGVYRSDGSLSSNYINPVGFMKLNENQT